MIVKLTDKNGKMVPINSHYYITALPATGHGKPFESIVYLGGDSALREINVKETTEEIYELLTPVPWVSEEVGDELSPLGETLPENVKRGVDGKLREKGKLMSKERLEELGL